MIFLLLEYDPLVARVNTIVWRSLEEAYSTVGIVHWEFFNKLVVIKIII